MSKSNAFLSKAIKDPLIHFLILGGLLFGLVSVLGGGRSAQDEIVITQAAQKHLADLFEITWQRKPNAEELKNLTAEHIKEEIYYREALALGLERNDTIVRRRLRQKLEFMQEDLDSLVEPTEAALKAFFNERKDEYTTDYIVSFQQITIAPTKLALDAPEITKALSALGSGTSPRSLSRSSLLPIAMKLETDGSVTNTFGGEFTAQIKQAKTGAWTGPLYSGFGTHLVNVSLRKRAEPLDYKQARSRVVGDYTQHQRARAAQDYYDNLKRQYTIIIDDMP